MGVGGGGVGPMLKINTLKKSSPELVVQVLEIRYVAVANSP